MMKFDPDHKALPIRSELPAIPGAPAGAAWFWGSNDEVRNHYPVRYCCPGWLSDSQLAWSSQSPDQDARSSSSEADKNWDDYKSQVHDQTPMGH